MKINDRKIDDGLAELVSDIVMAFDDGQEAARCGARLADCPFDGQLMKKAWVRGFIAAASYENGGGYQEKL